MEVIINFKWIKKILKFHSQRHTSADSADMFKWGTESGRIWNYRDI